MLASFLIIFPNFYETFLFSIRIEIQRIRKRRVKMLKNYEARHFFMAIGIGILLISPILLVFIPTFIGNSIYHTPGTWIVMVPKLSYILYGSGCALLVIAFFLMYFADLKKYSIILGIILIIGGVILLIHGTRPFTAISDDGIKMRADTGKEISSYTWQDIEYINYYDVIRSEGFDQFEFHFNDGTRLLLTENGYLMPYHKALMAKIRDEQLAVNWK